MGGPLGLSLPRGSSPRACVCVCVCVVFGMCLATLGQQTGSHQPHPGAQTKWVPPFEAHVVSFNELVAEEPAESKPKKKERAVRRVEVDS